MTSEEDNTIDFLREISELKTAPNPHDEREEEERPREVHVRGRPLGENAVLGLQLGALCRMVILDVERGNAVSVVVKITGLFVDGYAYTRME